MTEKMVKVLSTDEVIEILTRKIQEMNGIIDRLEIKDVSYSNKSFNEVKQALITVAVIRACEGLGCDAESYLGAVRNAVTDERTAPKTV